MTAPMRRRSMANPMSADSRTLKGVRNLSTPEKRRRWREFDLACERVMARKAVSDSIESFPEFPPELRRLECGAHARSGRPCRNTNLGPSARCKFHGGASTGPKTEAGKARSALNGRQTQRQAKRKGEAHEAPRIVQGFSSQQANSV